MNSVFILIAAMIVLMIAYILYGGWLAEQWGMNPKRKTPARAQEDGEDYVGFRSVVVFGHQFSALTGAGTIQGTVLAAAFGWIPVFLWLVLGTIFLGAAQNMGALFASIRSRGKTVGAVIQEQLGWRSGKWFLALMWGTTVFMLAVLLEIGMDQVAGIVLNKDGVLVQNVYHGAVGMIVLLMIPIAIIFGLLSRLKCSMFLSSLTGLVLMGAAIAAGVLFPLYLEKRVWLVIFAVYAVLAAVLPVWLLLQSRSYLGSLLLYGMVLVAAVGIFFQHPQMEMAPFQGWKVDGQWMVPALFIILAANVFSSYHAMLNSGVSSRQLDNERNMRVVGYGPLLLQGFCGVVVLIVVGCAHNTSGGIQSTQPFELFAGALYSLLQGFGFDEKWQPLVQVVIYVILAVLVTTSMDTCAKVGAVILQELFAGKEEKKNFMQNRIVAACVTVAAAVGLTFVEYQNIWSLLGIYLVLLVIPVCLGLIAWMKQMGNHYKMLLLPLGASGVITLINLIYYLVTDIQLLVNEGLDQKTQWNMIEVGFLLLAAVALTIFLMDGVRTKMKKRKIIFATGNEGKMREIREILGDLDAEILSLKEAGVEADVEENGSTFEENAIIKAKAICEKAGCLVLADDSGLEIDYLDKEPGVYSARYMGEDTPYTIKNNKLIERLDGVPKEDRTARFVCVIAAAFPDGKVWTTRGTMEGYIGYEEKGENGFGYDPIFFLDEFGCSSAELSMEEKNKISHRGKALRAMREKLV
ncbi:MAG: XTP/dITP diphosphatase [Eubacteriales bacterium]|nr:XTP/dITP diphosphatase [Eubacteriales bacterium]